MQFLPVHSGTVPLYVGYYNYIYHETENVTEKPPLIVSSKCESLLLIKQSTTIVTHQNRLQFIISLTVNNKKALSHTGQILARALPN